jgi:dTDP-4-dehydrorhamnose reductase
MSYRKEKLDAIIHLCAETDHEYCDVNPSNCYYINTVGTANVVMLARELDIPLVYIGTASVFDGKKGEPYESYDVPNPINHYNKSKYFGEIMAREHKKHYILRAGWMFGGGPFIDKKFVNKIITKITRGEKVIRVCDDCIGSPTYTLDLAECVKEVLESGTYSHGIYHATNKCGKGVSRYEFAQEIVKHFKGVAIEPCKIDDLKDEFPCKRTNYEVLGTDFNMRDWKSALKGYIYANY